MYRVLQEICKGALVMITTILMFIGLLFATGFAVNYYYKHIIKKYNTIELGDISYIICNSCGEKNKC